METRRAQEKIVATSPDNYLTASDNYRATA
jgi:hypothetical protein